MLQGWARTLECAQLLRDLLAGRHRPYVMFDNLPRVGDAERFLALLREG